MKKYFCLILTLVILAGCSGYRYQIETKVNNTLEYLSKPFIAQTQQKSEKTPEENKQEENPRLPNQTLLEMVFSSQAPYANWDQLHDEACEEASLLLVHYYLQDKRSLSPDQAEQEIQEMVDWQVENYGGHYDLTIEKLAQFAKDYYGYKDVQIVENVEIVDIKRKLSEGNPVIIPAAGRMLGNPYFRQPGPIYHMLVIKGYNSKYFITNDVGTRRGEGFQYKFETLYDAVHDFSGKSEEEMLKGQKVMLIIKN